MSSKEETDGTILAALIGGIGFGFWYESGGAGTFMAIVLLVIISVLDSVEGWLGRKGGE